MDQFKYGTMLGVNIDQYVGELPDVVLTTEAVPLCAVLLSKTHVEAHTVEYVTGNQCFSDGD